MPKSDRKLYTEPRAEPEPEVVESAEDKQERVRKEATAQELASTGFSDRVYSHHLGGSTEPERESFQSTE